MVDRVYMDAICTYNHSMSSPNDTLPLLKIEENFDMCLLMSWWYNNWSLCYYIIAVYLVAIFAGEKYMRSRPAFQLRGPLLAWNVALATYSAITAWRMVPATIYSINNFGFWAQCCDWGPAKQMQATSLWLFLFAMSKVVELGDTAFIVLRKTPLIVLHWYHHVTVLFFTWSGGAYPSPMLAIFCSTNVCVHTIMYSYYALKVLRIRIPKLISMAITSLQLVQMVLGMFVTGSAYYVKSQQAHCLVKDQALLIAASIYFSYFVLFSHFFFRTYIRAGPERAKKTL